MTTLTDGIGRRIDYLRLSLTDRCDLRCRYCIPKGFHDFQPPSSWLTPAELEQVVAAFAALGVRRVRLTGGEPLTRRDVLDIAERLGGLPGVEDLSLTTNATRLKQYAGPLKHAGVGRLNISLDSLRRERFRAITGADALSAVLAGIDAAIEAGFTLVKVNMVAMAGINEDEVEDMVTYCMEQGLILRLIEPMPMGASGREVKPADLSAIRRRLQSRLGLVDGVIPGGGPARYLRSSDGRFSIGFITPMSQHFCATCNRVRLSADGRLYTCLGDEEGVDLGMMIRSGSKFDDFMVAVCGAVRSKLRQHEFNDRPYKIVRNMSKTGG
jgi:cyclic pyranopterin phosphate synthase